MNRLTNERRAQVVAALVEGCSVRSTVRMTGVAKNTVSKLLLDLGAACSAYHWGHVRNLKCKRIECDEIWSFIGAKEKNVPKERRGEFGIGDCWTWVGLDPESKLIVSWLVGRRDGDYAKIFMKDLASRLSHRVQLTTDGHSAYLDAVEEAFGGDIDYAMLVKLFGAETPTEARYSPPKCIGCKKTRKVGKPDKALTSTSLVERQNLTMRMRMRRFTRLTNAYSKKFANHAAACSIHFAHYNLCRIHETIRCTPAMAAGVSDHVWSLAELISLLERQESLKIPSA